MSQNLLDFEAQMSIDERDFGIPDMLANVSPVHRNNGALPREVIHQVAVRIAIHLDHGGGFDGAHRVLDDLEAESKRKPPKGEAVLKIALAQVLSVRTANILESAGLTTVGDLLGTTREELMGFASMGEGGLAEVLKVAKAMEQRYLERR